MRDIKFRAWDNLEKRMRKVVSLHWQGDKLVSARLEGENEPIPIEGQWKYWWAIAKNALCA